MEGLWNGFDFYYVYLDRIYRIIGIFFACGEGFFGRKPHYHNYPVDLVQFFFKIRIHSSFSFKFYSFYLIRLAVFQLGGAALKDRQFKPAVFQAGSFSPRINLNLQISLASKFNTFYYRHTRP